MIKKIYFKRLPARADKEFENMEMSGGDFANL